MFFLIGDNDAYLIDAQNLRQQAQLSFFFFFFMYLIFFELFPARKTPESKGWDLFKRLVSNTLSLNHPIIHQNTDNVEENRETEMITDITQYTHINA